MSLRIGQHASTRRTGSTAPSRGAHSAPWLGPSQGHCAFTSVGVEPVAVVSLLPLQGHGQAQVGRGGFIEGEMGNAALPQADVDAGGGEQHRREHAIALAAGQPQVEQRILRNRLDLGCQHAGGRAPRFAIGRAPVDDEHPPTGHGQLARARRPNGAGADYDNIKYGSHLYSDETI